MIEFYSIPKWVKYIAQDNNGSWFGFENKPCLIGNGGQWDYKGKRTELSVVVSSTLQQVN